MQATNLAPAHKTETRDKLIHAFNQLLVKVQEVQEHTCHDGQVSLHALCVLLGRNGKQTAWKLQHEYRSYAENNNLPLYIIKKRFADNTSSKAKAAWINVQDAASFLRSRTKKNSDIVNNFLHEISQIQTALDTNNKVQEAVARKDKEFEKEREEHATQQEFDQAAIETLTSENNDLKKRAGRDWKLLDSLPPAKRGKFSAALTSEKALHLALEAYTKIDKHYKATTSAFKNIRYETCGVPKGITTKMMNKSHLRPQQVRQCIDSAGADCESLIRMPTGRDTKDIETKLSISDTASQHLGMLKLLESLGATKEQVKKVDKELIKPQWEEEANKNKTTCRISHYEYDSGLRTDRGRHIEAAQFFIANYKTDPTGWPIIKIMLPHLNEKNQNPGQFAKAKKIYLESRSAYQPLLSYYIKHSLVNTKVAKQHPKKAWQSILELCEKYALGDMPDSMRYMLRIFTMDAYGPEAYATENNIEIDKQTHHRKDTASKSVHQVPGEFTTWAPGVLS